MMEINVAIVVVAITATERDSIHPFEFNQESRLVSDVVGQGGEAATKAYGPHYVQDQSKSSFLPYSLPPNYTPPTVVYAPSENVGNSTPIFIENQQPQPDHTYAHVSQTLGKHMKLPKTTLLASFGVYSGYTIEGHAFSGVFVPNTSGGPQYQPPPQPLHFVMGGGPPAIVEKKKFDHMENRLRAIEGGGNYGFADMSELCLVPNVVIPLKFKVSEFDKYKGITCPNNHLKMYCKKMRAYVKDEKLFMHFFQKSLVEAVITWYTNLKPSRIRS